MSGNHSHYDPSFVNFFKKPVAAFQHSFNEATDPAHLIAHLFALEVLVGVVKMPLQTGYDYLMGNKYRGPKDTVEVFENLLGFKFKPPKNTHNEKTDVKKYKLCNQRKIKIHSQDLQNLQMSQYRQENKRKPMKM